MAKLKEWGSEKEIYTRKCMFLFMHRYRYYILNDPIISDTAYDELESELKKYELSNPKIKHPHSPTTSVGSGDFSSYPSSVIRYLGKGSGSKKAKTKLTLPKKCVKKVKYIQEDLF